jgi:hypothetical protein
MAHADRRDARHEHEHDQTDDGNRSVYGPDSDKFSICSLGCRELTVEPAKEDVQPNGKSTEASESRQDALSTWANLGQNAVAVERPTDGEVEQEFHNKHATQTGAHQQDTAADRDQPNEATSRAHQGFSGGSACKISSSDIIWMEPFVDFAQELPETGELMCK